MARLLLPDLRKLARLEPQDWLGNPILAETSRPRRGPVPGTFPAILGATQPVDCTCCGTDFDALAGRIEALLEAYPDDRSLTTWIVLVALFVTDKLIAEVARHTPQPVSDAYFGGNRPTWAPFEQRMTAYLCGELAAAPTAGTTKTTVRHSCTAPVVAVAWEQQILATLLG